MSRIDDLIAEHCPDGVEFKPLGDIGTIFGGLTGKSKADFANGNARYISYVNVFNNIAVNVEANDFVQVEAGERQRTLRRGDILFTGSSETADEACMSSVVTSDISEPLYLNSFCIGFRLSDPKTLYPEFSKYLFRSNEMRKQLVRTASGVTRFNVSKARLARVKIPVPPPTIQREIAKVLDTFTKLGAALEAELEARRQQYRHYRDALLTFDAHEERKQRSAAQRSAEKANDPR
jgi:type I restriction enzyme S subunit